MIITSTPGRLKKYLVHERTVFSATRENGIGGVTRDVSVSGNLGRKSRASRRRHVVTLKALASPARRRKIILNNKFN
jgi:hypothetical protein